MALKLLILRSDKDLSWIILIHVPHKFDAKRWPGYRYYKSFPNNTQGRFDAQEYAKSVEISERSVKL